VARDADVDALVKELDQALASVQRAQRIAADLRRGAKGRQRRLPERSPVPLSRDLRHTGMTVAETAVALGISEDYVRRLLRRGILVGSPYGGRTGWRLDRDYVLRLQREIATAKQGQAAARRELIARSKGAASDSVQSKGRTS